MLKPEDKTSNMLFLHSIKKKPKRSPTSKFRQVGALQYQTVRELEDLFIEGVSLHII